MTNAEASLTTFNAATSLGTSWLMCVIPMFEAQMILSYTAIILRTSRFRFAEEFTDDDLLVPL